MVTSQRPTVFRGEEWLRGLDGFVAASRAEHPGAPADDLLACVWAWTCYTAASIYPFDELIGGGPLLPEPMRAYARDRQRALETVMGQFKAIEDTLREAMR
jgi:hypothetical protein